MRKKSGVDSCGVGARGKINMEAKKIQVRRVSEVEEEIRLAGGWRRRTIYVGRQQAAHTLWLLKANRRGGISRQHIGPVVRTGERPGKGRREDVVSHVIGVRPHTEFGVIRKGGERERISIIAARGVRRGRDRHAVQIWRRKHGLCRDPTTGGFVVLNDDVAVVVSLASSSKALPEGIPGSGAHHDGTCGLVEHFECDVDPHSTNWEAPTAPFVSGGTKGPPLPTVSAALRPSKLRSTVACIGVVEGI